MNTLRTRRPDRRRRFPQAARSEENAWTTPLIKTTVVCIAFFADGNFHEKIMPGGEESNLQQYIILTLWLLIALVSYFRRAALRIEASAGLGVGLAFYALAVISIAWSGNFAASLPKGAAMAIVLFCAWRLTRSLAFDDIVEGYLLGLFGLCATAIVVAIAAPDIGVLKTWQHAGQWNGIFVTKQTLGIGGALLLFFSSYRLLDASRRPWHYAAAAVALVCVIASGSRGGGALAAVSVVCVYLTRQSTRFARGLAFAPFVMILLGIALTAYFVATGNKYLVLFDAELDFTERSFIWQHALRFYPSAPWFGHGLNGFWTLKDVKDIFVAQHGWFLDDYHDGYIAIVMETGAIGMGVFACGYLLYALRLLAIIRRGGALDRDTGVMLVHTCLVFFMDFTETVFMRSTNITSTFLAMGLFVAYGRRPRPAPEDVSRTRPLPARAGGRDRRLVIGADRY